jgi:hypothetical protein
MRIYSLAIGILALAFTGLAACGDDDGMNEDQLTCQNYCTSITTNCINTNQQFTGMTDCMSTCMHYPVGTAADMAGNTLGCRTYHAGAAMTGPDVHCRHAGPGGNDACGADCLGFCSLVLSECTGANVQYGGDMGQCMTACGGFATTPAYNSMQTSGNTFACRLYHATAASLDPMTHCKHTGTTSDTCK